MERIRGITSLEALVALAMSGCSGPPVGGDGATDDSTGDATSDASPQCDPLATFNAPAKIVELASDRRDTVPRLTSDELTLVYARQASAFPGDFNYDLYSATRSSTSDPFATPVAAEQINTTTYIEANPTISSDGLSLYFDTSRDGGQIYVATRTSTADAFGPGTPVVALNTASVDSAPFITDDGLELWFASDGFDLFSSRWSATGFASVTREESLNSPSVETLPVLSADKRTIYLASERPGGMGHLDILRSHRTTTSDVFPTPVLVSDLSSPVEDLPGWLSSDGCRFYFSSSREGVHALFMASR